MTTLRPLVRRPTGGGLVPHDADWTYSLVFPPAAPWYTLKAVESYQKVHAWVQGAFSEIKFQTELASNAGVSGMGQCFLARNSTTSFGARERSPEGRSVAIATDCSFKGRSSRRPGSRGRIGRPLFAGSQKKPGGCAGGTFSRAKSSRSGLQKLWNRNLDGTVQPKALELL